MAILPKRPRKSGFPATTPFTVLPYVELEGIFNMGAGQFGWPVSAAKKATLAKRNRVPVALFHCPSRRPAVCTPMGPGGVPGGSGPGSTRGFYNADRTPVMIRNDYAANCGTNWSGFNATSFSYINTTYDRVEDSLFPPVSLWNGISFARSEVNQADVLDGTTKTYMIGEKYLNPDYYHEGLTGGDDEGAYNGISADQYRFSDPSHPPWQDQAGFDGSWHWGSVHPDAFHMVMCDGSVHPISYDIDPDTHRRLGNRKDGEQVNISTL